MIELAVFALVVLGMPGIVLLVVALDARRRGRDVQWHVPRGFPALAVGLLSTGAATPGAAVTDAVPNPTIATTTDITTKRGNLINEAWGISTGVLPTTPSTVTIDFCNGVSITSTPCPAAFNSNQGYTHALTNVVRVDKYVSAMTNGQTYINYLYVANSPSNNRVVFISGGHDYTCDFTQIQDGAGAPGTGYGSGHTYRIQDVMQALLSAGFSVFAYSMPRPLNMPSNSEPCGSVGDHNTMFSAPGVGSYGNVAMQYFLEASVEAMNYWDAHASFSDYNWIGLSGGGWTTTVMAALDPRVKTSVIVSGNLPGAMWSTNCNKCTGDAEQFNDAFYSIAGYVDLMVMGSTGTGRRQLQIMNFQDNCCFGAAYYTTAAGVGIPGGPGTGWGMATTYGIDYATYVGNYATAIKNLAATIGAPLNYNNVIDYGPAAGWYPPPTGSAIPNGAVEHQISPWAQGQILVALAPTGPTGGGRRSRGLLY